MKLRTASFNHVPLLTTLSWGLADQLLISISNFLTTALLARSVASSSFGIFVLMYSVLLLLNIFQYAFIVSPQVVLSAGMSKDSFAMYTRQVGLLQVAMAGIFFLMLAFVAIALELLDTSHGLFCVAAAAALFTWQLQEFLRRIAYAESDPAQAFVNDIISYGLQAAIFLALYHLDLLTPTRAMLVIFLTSLLGTIYGLTRNRWLLSGARAAYQPGNCALAHWQYGKWLLGAELTTWMGTGAYVFIAGAIAGVEAAATIRLVQVALGPVHVLIRFVDVSLTPKFGAVLHSSGWPATKHLAKIAAVVIAAPVAIAVIASITLSSQILQWLFGRPYYDYGWVLTALAVSYVCYLVASCGAVLLRITQRTPELFRASLVATVVSLPSGLVGAWEFGLKGAVAAMLLHAGLFAEEVWHLTTSKRRNHIRESSDALPEALP